MNVLNVEPRPELPPPRPLLLWAAEDDPECSILDVSRSGDRRQQGGPRHADLGVGLDDLGNGDRDIEIVDLSGLHQLRQFARPKTTPPIQRRNGCVGCVMAPFAIGRRHLKAKLRLFAAEDAAGQPRTEQQRGKR